MNFTLVICANKSRFHENDITRASWRLKLPATSLFDENFGCITYRYQVFHNILAGWVDVPCPGPKPGRYPDPDCRFYLHCTHTGTPQARVQRFACPDGLYFNPVTTLCDHSANVPNCGEESSTGSTQWADDSGDYGDTGVGCKRMNWLKLTLCGLVTTYILVHIDSCNGLLPDNTKALLETTLTYHQRCSVAFNWLQFHRSSHKKYLLIVFGV